MNNISLALILAKILKTYPLSWWTGLSEELAISKDRLRQQLYGFERNGFLTFKTDIAGNRLVLLTNKGFLRVEKILLTDYKYRNFKEGRKGLGASDLHQFMIFRFLVSYLQEKKDCEKVISYNSKSAKVSTRYFGTEVFIMPDLSIYRDNEIDFIEVDTGLETSYQIYIKLIKYFSILLYKPISIDAEKVSLYFSLSSKKSLITLFGSERNTGLIYKHFEKFSNNVEVSKNRSININTNDILSITQDGRVTIYAGYVKDPLNQYIQINLEKRIQHER